METSERRFKGAVSLEKILSKVSEDPIGYLERWPIKEVRNKCIKVLESQGVYSYQAESIEKCIKDLLDKGDSSWFDILGVYLFKLQDFSDTEFVRAIEFAISLSECSNLENKLSKSVISRLFENDIDIGEIYPLLSRMPGFLKKILEKISEKAYFSNDWQSAERALRLIVATKDISYLPTIERLIYLHEKGVAKPWNDKGYQEGKGYQKDINIVVLKYCNEILKKARAEKMKRRKAT